VLLEDVKKAVQEAVQKVAQEAAQDAEQEAVQEAVQVVVQQAAQEAVQEAVREVVQEVGREQEVVSGKKPVFVVVDGSLVTVVDPDLFVNLQELQVLVPASQQIVV